MQLTATLTLVGFDSLDELAATPAPVKPASSRQQSVIDISVGLKTVTIHADDPLDGWRLITCADTRFDIHPETTGKQLATALADTAVIKAMNSIINPPPPPSPLTKKQLAKINGSETHQLCVNRLIDALSKHVTVLRAKTHVDEEVVSFLMGDVQLSFV